MRRAFRGLLSADRRAVRCSDDEGQKRPRPSYSGLAFSQNSPLQNSPFGSFGVPSSSGLRFSTEGPAARLSASVICQPKRRRVEFSPGALDTVSLASHAHFLDSHAPPGVLSQVSAPAQVPTSPCIPQGDFVPGAQVPTSPPAPTGDSVPEGPPENIPSATTNTGDKQEQSETQAAAEALRVLEERAAAAKDYMLAQKVLYIQSVCDTYRPCQHGRRTHGPCPPKWS